MKNYLYVVYFVLISALLMSCNDSNAPGKTDESSLPAIMREIQKANVSETKTILEEKGFTLVSVDDKEGEYVYLYPKAFASDDDNTREKAYKQDWMSIMCYTGGSKYAQGIEGTQHLPTAEKAFDKMKSWINYMPTLIKNPDLHYIIIDEGGDGDDWFMFTEGSLWETYRTYMLAQLAAMYAEGRISTAEYEAEKAMLNVTKDDLNQKIASLSLKREFVIQELYCELSNKRTYQGVQTVSYYYNNTQSTEGIAENETLEHMVVIGDMTEVVGEYIIQ